MKSEFIYTDQIIYDALRKRKKVELFLCKDEEMGFGIKIDGKQFMRNLAWESFEYPVDEYLSEAQIKEFANPKEKKNEKI